MLKLTKHQYIFLERRMKRTSYCSNALIEKTGTLSNNFSTELENISQVMNLPRPQDIRNMTPADLERLEVIDLPSIVRSRLNEFNLPQAFHFKEVTELYKESSKKLDRQSRNHQTNWEITKEYLEGKRAVPKPKPFKKLLRLFKNLLFCHKH